MARTKPTPVVKMSSEEKRWRTEDAMRTLQRAAEIQKDAGLMRDVKKATTELNKLVMGGSITKAKKK
jgi:hypothetical protein